MIVKPDKHHAMVLGTTDYKFSFPVVDSVELLGMTIENQLNFIENVSLVCKKVNYQLNVCIFRFRNRICTFTKLKLYNAFIFPTFNTAIRCSIFVVLETVKS